MSALAGPALVLASVLSAQSAIATPPPPEQLAADCDATTYASDVLVCGDPALRALDARMREMLAAAGRLAALQDSTTLIEAQPAWFRRRSLCAFSARHAACLRAAYLDRIAVLEAMRAPRSPQGAKVGHAICADAPWGAAAVDLRFEDSGYLVVSDASDIPLAIATRQLPFDNWSAFVRMADEKDGVRLEPLAGTPFVCRFGGQSPLP